MKYVRAVAALGLLALFIAFNPFTTGSRAAGAVVPDLSADDAPAPTKSQRTIVLAGGCFWGMEEVFEHVKGVSEVVSGYAGGAARTASYELVSSGTTGHAESVKITYDPSQLTLGQLLKVFFSVAHDPTQRNAQWPDRGPQYRSVVFYTDDHQQQIARSYIGQIDSAHVFRDPVATEIAPLTAFYPAEPYHQDYAKRHPTDRYIVQIDQPKVENLKKLLPVFYVG